MMKIGSKIISVLMIFLVAAIVSPAMVNADNFGLTVPVEINNLRINGHDVSASATDASIFFRNNDMTVSFDVKAFADLEDVEVQVAITGFKNNQYNDERMSEVKFYKSIPANKSMPVDMTLDIPDNIDTKDAKFRILVSTADSSMAPFNFNLALQAPDDQVEIRDILLSKEEVKAGTSVFANVRLRNNGAYDQEDIKITAEVDDLNIKDTAYINLLETDDTETSEDLLLRIPVSAEPGKYVLDVTAEYADGHEEVRDSVYFWVTESDVQTNTNTNTNTNTCTNNCNTNTNNNTNNGNTNTNTNTNNNDGVLINYDSNSKVLTQGEGGAIYSITIANQGNTAKSFVIDASGVDWATVKLSPGNLVVVSPGETKAVYVYASAKEDATVGTHEFTAVIKSGSTVVGTASFKADVVEAAGSLNKTAFNAILTYLLIAFVIVLAIAVILLGITRNKGGNSKKPQEQQTADYDSTQSYY